MICTYCGFEYDDTESRCPKCGCGKPLKGEENISFVYGPEPVPNSNIFILPDEQLLGKLGNGFFTNLLFYSASKCHALLTNKRIYLQGVIYSGSGKNILKTKEERILDLEDITGTGFIYEDFSLIVAMLIFVISEIIPCIISAILHIPIGVAVVLGTFIGFIFVLLNYYMSRKIWFWIEYAGGKIKIDAKIIGLSDVEDFHKQIRRAKDVLKGKE